MVGPCGDCQVTDPAFQQAKEKVRTGGIPNYQVRESLFGEVLQREEEIPCVEWGRHRQTCTAGD